MRLLSVVLPVYNVEEYLAEALDSLARQTYRNIEVVMVDDGSTDRSPEIAARFAETDSRFRLVTQDNHGLGHARNTGLRHVTGDYVAFVDSDDVVPHYAYRMIVATLEQTGSDFLSGNEYRIDYRGARPATMLEAGFARTRLKTNVTERRELLRDLLPHNKIYRRTFWEGAQLSFPEGIWFEDGPVSVKAHALATSVDVVSTPMYYWRLRDGASRSLSQEFGDARFFVDRITASTLSLEFLRARRTDLLDDFFNWDIRHKFPVMFLALPTAPAGVRKQFIDAAADHLREAPEHVVKGLPPGLRRRVELTRDHDLAGLLALLPKPAVATTPAGPPSAPVAPAGRSLVSTARRVLARSHALRVVRAFARATPATASVKSAVTDLGAEGDDLVVKGFAFVAGLPADGLITSLNRVMWARHDGSRRLALLRLRATGSEEAVTFSTDAQFAYTKAGFVARLPLRHLRDAQGGWRYGAWSLTFGAATARGLAREGLRWGRDYRADFAPVALDPTTWLVPTVTTGVLGFRIDQADATLLGCEARDDSLHLTARLATPVPEKATVIVGRVVGVAEASAGVECLADGHRFRAAVDLSTVVEACVPVAPVPISGQPDRLVIGLRPEPDDLSPHPLVCPADFAGFTAHIAGHRIAVQATAEGWLSATVRPAGPTLESVSWDESGALLLRGRGADLVDHMSLVARHSDYRQQRLLPCAVGADGSWESRFHPERVGQAGGAAALRSGTWFLVLRTSDPAGGHLDVDLPYAPEVFAGGSGTTIGYGERYSLRRNGLDGVALSVEPRLSSAERSSYHTRRLRQEFYPAARRTHPLRDVVVYDSFYGKQYSDSPRAVYEELLARKTPVEHVWVTRDAQAPVPDGTRTVEANSREYFELLATSRYIVNNTHLPTWMQRRDGQVVAQTWHGIGFKRVAFDMDTVHFANPSYLKALREEAKHWSFLVSPSAFCTEIMRRAFRYQGEIAEIGSPRNDILFTVKQEEAAAALRAELGIAPERKLLLYAPTWRDNEFYGPGRYKFAMHLDVARLPESVRDEYALLVRRHPNTVDDLLGFDSDFVHDVANFPDARDLLAAADVLITDYSTIALDFLNTGRPILFYTYDLENYRDNLRGFYFDLEKDGPGPVLQTSAEVAEALGDLDHVVSEYQARYQRFREIYCHAEDGRATERLVERLLRDS